VSLVHSWDYRRYLISSILQLSTDPERLALRNRPLPEPLPTTESELLFTTRKISKNFSNFSAWHYRTKLLNKLSEERVGWKDENNPERQKRVDQGKLNDRRIKLSLSLYLACIPPRPFPDGFFLSFSDDS